MISDTPAQVRSTNRMVSYRSIMGLIFGAIAAAWLVYLVPYFLHRRGLPADEIDAAYATTTITIVRTGTDLAQADEGTEEKVELSQKAKLDALTRADRRAAARRRSVLGFLLIAQIVVAILAVLGIGAWWGALVPVGMIIAFLVISRITIRSTRANLERRAREITEAEAEDTAALRLTEADVAEHEHSVELSIPVPKLQTLWEPIAITRPTYVSQPLAPRTVRTIDLSPPSGIPIIVEDDETRHAPKRNAG